MCRELEGALRALQAAHAREQTLAAAVERADLGVKREEVRSSKALLQHQSMLSTLLMPLVVVQVDCLRLPKNAQSCVVDSF
jgi:hypothetical protein